MDTTENNPPPEPAEETRPKRAVAIRLFVPDAPDFVIPPYVYWFFPPQNIIGTTILSHALMADLKSNGVISTRSGCGPLNSALFVIMVDDVKAALSSVVATRKAVDLLDSASVYYFCPEEIFFRRWHACAADTGAMFTLANAAAINEAASQQNTRALEYYKAAFKPAACKRRPKTNDTRCATLHRRANRPCVERHRQRGPPAP